jgi:RimJ/RimL family protein N-acetyltransferase
MASDGTLPLPAEGAAGRTISGEPVDRLPSSRFPLRTRFVGAFAALEPLDPQAHGEDLYALSHDGSEAGRRLWDYLAYGPFPDRRAFDQWLRDQAAAPEPLIFAVRDLASGLAAGMAGYLRIQPHDGSVEIGHIWFAPALQRTRAATEALVLMLVHAFDDLGYRRVEWKCNALNGASKRAALRLGFRFEGIFYRHMVTKGRNRDTAWFSLLDEEWPPLRLACRRWLAPENFDPAGRQRLALSALTGALVTGAGSAPPALP